MTRRVYKYDVPPGNEFNLMLPEGAQPLTVQVQFHRPQLWALVDPEAPPVEHCFRIVETGRELPPERCWTYLGTWQMLEGRYVLHLFMEVQT